MDHARSSAGVASRLDGGVLRAGCDAAVAALELPGSPFDALDAALAALHERVPGSHVAGLVLEHDRLWLVGMRGYTMIPDGIALDDGVVGYAADTGEIQFLPNVDGDDRFVPVVRGVRSELAIPVHGERGVLGVLNIETDACLPADAPEICAPLAAALAAILEAIRTERTIDLSALARLFVHIGSLRDPRVIADVAAHSFARIVPLETCQVALLDDSRRLAETATWQSPGDAPQALSARAIESLCDRVESTAVFELLDAGVMHAPELAGSRLRTVAIVPLRANGEDVGVMIGQSRFPRTYDHRQAEMAALLGAHVAASIDAALALSRERRSALTDPLTGLLNRRGFEERLERELDLAQDDRAPLTLMVIDCDDFKEVNDRAGHEFGDALLREIGVVLSSSIGSADCASRLGGDEFVAMFPGLDAERAAERSSEVLDRVREGLDTAGFPLHLSAGVATYPYDGGSASQLLRTADQALYDAKAQGKNRVVAFRDVVRSGSSAIVIAPAPSDRRRGGRGESVLEEVLEAATALAAEPTVDGVLDRLAKSVTFVVGATGCLVSLVEGQKLSDAVRHALRDVDFGDEVAYLIDDFPVTRDVLETGRSRSISFLDDDLDRAEAFVLREVRMNCCLLVPLLVAGKPWGLVEVYDMRMRRFSREDEAISEFLVGQAARRIEALGDTAHRRRLPLFRLPTA